MLLRGLCFVLAGFKILLRPSKYHSLIALGSLALSCLPATGPCSPVNAKACLSQGTFSLIGNFSLMRILSADNNDFNGTIPGALVGRMRRIGSLTLSNNTFDGVVPDPSVGQAVTCALHIFLYVAILLMVLLASLQPAQHHFCEQEMLHAFC